MGAIPGRPLMSAKLVEESGREISWEALPKWANQDDYHNTNSCQRIDFL
jgi:hypothetical protein